MDVKEIVRMVRSEGSHFKRFGGSTWKIIPVLGYVVRITPIYEAFIYIYIYI